MDTTQAAIIIAQNTEIISQLQSNNQINMGTMFLVIIGIIPMITVLIRNLYKM